MTCPICGNPVPKDAPTAPFCSKRCRTIDLANWAEGKYHIPAEEPGPETDEDDEEREQ